MATQKGCADDAAEIMAAARRPTASFVLAF